MFDDVGKWWAGVMGGRKKPGARCRAAARKNPAKLDRCVRKVKASAKKRHYSLKSAYAICNAAMSRKNPSQAEKVVIHKYQRALAATRGTREYETAISELREAVARLESLQSGYSKNWHGKLTTAETAGKGLRRNPNTLHDRLEFENRRNMPYVERRYMPGARMNTTELSLRGTTIAIKTETLKRGKVVSVDYWLPAFHGDPLGHLPVSRKNPARLVEASQSDVMAFMDGRMSLQQLRNKSLGRPKATPKRRAAAKPKRRSGPNNNVGQRTVVYSRPVTVHRKWTTPRVGQRVVFGRALGQDRHGIVERINARSITVRTTDGKKWRVPPKYFRNHPDHKALQQQKAARRGGGRRRGYGGMSHEDAVIHRSESRYA